MNLLTLYIYSTNFLDNSCAATRFPILDVVPDRLPHTPTIDHERAEVADPDHATEDIRPAATTATIQDAPVTVDMGPIPSNPDASGKTILPGLDTSTQGVGCSDEAVGATDLTAASLGGSSNIGPIESLSEQGANEPMAPTAPDLASLTADALDQKNPRYQRKSKMVVSTTTTARYGVHSPYQGHSANCPCRNLCAIDWCASHPEGTLGEFNWYYDKLPAEEANVILLFSYSHNDSTDENPGIQAEGEKRSGCGA